MKNHLLILSILIATSCHAQTDGNKYNLGFEKQTENAELSDSWFQWGDYTLSVEPDCKSGSRSGKVTSTESGNFGCIAYSIPANYEGKSIELQAYMKINNVEEGFAGLLFRIDGNGDILEFNNMADQNITGTADWQKYSIKLNYPENAEKIIVGGILTGKGEALFDDFTVYIDGKDIQTMEESETRASQIAKNSEIILDVEFTDTELSRAQIQNLKVLGLIWGFLKYYHPNVANGDYNWDMMLMEILPEILNAENNQSRDSILYNWIANLGELEPADNQKPESGKFFMKPDLDWISNSDFSEDLTSILLEVENAKRPKKNHYVSLQFNVKNPDFKNELKYEKLNYPNTGYRLLALFRYWNIIQYYFPYKNLIEEDWKDVLEEFIPKMVYAKDDIEYTLNILELIGRVHDTHANIRGWSPLIEHFGLRYANVKLTFIEDKAVVTDFYEAQAGKETGLQIGDIIVSINDKPVNDIVQERLKYTPASNYPTQLRDIAPNLLRTNDSIINVEYIRDNKLAKTTITTYPSSEINFYKQSNDTCFKLINKDIAYIDNGSLKTAYLPKIWKKVKKTDGLILDLRNYPSDFPIYALSKYLMPKSTPFIKFTNGSIENPGLFTFTGNSFVGSKNEKHYTGKVIIIVNEITQSSSEFHAMAYRVHPNTIVIGSTTAGADGNVSEIYLPGGLRTMISGIGVYYPDGSETQRIGIIPDIEVKPTIQGLKEGRDELLEKAISLIEEE